MASVRFTDVQSRPTEFLDFTSLTLEEFQALVPPCEAAFQAHMATWRLDGKPRTARQFTVYNPTTTSALDMLIFLAYVASKHADHPPPQEAKDVTGKSHARRGVRPPTV
ncbi:MAG TPA: hypothetical protein VLQ80_34625 [Candidatus Saccharimonadia bacterium]|nr:hypothetical protein [Candidatus Saccharimonadia bacterium]